MILPGMIASKPGGGSAPYIASAVHFDGSACLDIASLTALGDDTGFLSFAVWLKCAVPVSDDELWCLNASSDQNGLADISNIAKFNIAMYDASGNDALVNTSPAVFITVSWFLLMVTMSSDFDAGDKILQIYLGDTAYTFTKDDASPAFVFTFDGQEFSVGAWGTASPNKYVGDMANFWFAPGQFVDFSNQANRRKFIDAGGKPVNLGADGSTPTGTAPAIFFSGDAAAFATNAGTGGAFTLTGSLTNASTSPSD